MARRRRTQAERRREAELDRVPQLRRKARGWFMRALLVFVVAGALAPFLSFLAALVGLAGLACAGQGVRVAVSAQRLEDAGPTP